MLSQKFDEVSRRQKILFVTGSAPAYEKKRSSGILQKPEYLRKVTIFRKNSFGYGVTVTGAHLKGKISNWKSEILKNELVGHF